MTTFDNAFNDARNDIQDIARDGFMNGTDLTAAQRLEASMSALSEFRDSDEYIKLKQSLRSINEKMLKDGYTVRNFADYNALKKILAQSHGEIRLPTKSSISDGRFSVVLEGGKLKVYSVGTTFGSRLGYIEDGVFKKDYAYTDMEKGSNNNKYNLGNSGRIPRNTLTPKKSENVSGQQEVQGGGISIIEIRGLGRTDTVKKIKALGLNNMSYNSLRSNKEYTALLQKALTFLNLDTVNNYKGEFVDGDYGSSTINAVKDFQKLVGYSDEGREVIDGKAGKGTNADLLLKLENPNYTM